ncbi:MAG: trigger factor [Candidatus Peribacteraceae bacterium]
MEITVEKLKQSRIKTTAVIPPDALKHAEEQALTRLGNTMDIKGFRQGKAPLPLIRERVKPEDLLEETVRILLPEIVSASLEKSGAKPILRPSAGIASQNPLTITLTFVERPTVFLRKPEKIDVEQKSVAEAGAADVEQFIRKILLQDRTENPVDRPAARGDTIRMSLTAKDDKGKQVDELTIERLSILLGSEDLLPELEAHLLSMKKEEKKTVTVAFPLNHDIVTVRGRKITLEIAAKEVAEVKLPELTAEFIKIRLGAECTPEAFRADVRGMLTRQRKTEEMKRREEELYRKVREATTTDLAPELIDAEVQGMLEDLIERLKKQESTLEQWLKSTKKEWKDLVEEMRKIAVDRITLRFGMQELAKSRKTEPTDEEISSAIKEAEKSGAHAGHHHPAEDSAPGGALYEEIRFELQMQKLVRGIVGEI